MKMISLIIVVFMVLVMASTTNAIVVSVDADGHADGADISNAFTDITLSSVGTYSELDGLVYARVSSFASTGEMVFGNSMLGTDAQGTPGNQLWYQSVGGMLAFRLRADFAQPADYVAIDIITNNTQDTGILEAYNSAGVLLTSVTGTSYSGTPLKVEINRPSFDIAYIISSGINGETICLDNLQTNILPEPATIVLLGLGGLALTRRRKSCGIISESYFHSGSSANPH